MKKVNFNNRQMTLLSSAFLDNLFPRPYLGDLKTGDVIITREGDKCDFYFSEDYFNKLRNHIIGEYNLGKFDRSNAASDWINLMNKFDYFEEVSYDTEGLKNYWLSVDRDKEQKEKEAIENNKTSNDQSFDSLTDKEGNIYKTIRIGNQVWLAENYKCTTKSNGEKLNYIENNDEWLRNNDSNYCYFNNDESQKNLGTIYNWKSINEDIFPEGWKVPSKEDWDELSNFLIENKFNYDGSTEKFWGNKFAKSLSSVEGWRESRKVGTPGYESEKNNTSKFSGIPCGFRFPDGRFSNTPESAAFWWSSTQCDGGKTPAIEDDFVINYVLYFEYSSLDSSQQVKKFGSYLRLIKE